MERGSLKNRLFILCLTLFLAVSTALYFIPSERDDKALAEDIAAIKLFHEVTTQSTSGLSVEFVNVGQGDCTFISCNGRNMLIDSGEGEYHQLVGDFLRKRNVTHFDYVLLSHPHSDHAGGMKKIIENYSIGTFLLPDVKGMNMEKDDPYFDMLSQLEEKGVYGKTVTAGEIYRLSDAEIEILGPLRTDDEENETSVICMLKYGESKFLFTGDAPVSEELDLIESGADLDCDVLKVSHHGSNDATSDEFLDCARPEYAVISVAEYNEYRHPHGKTLKKLLRRDISVYRTDKNGTVRFRIPHKNSEIMLP